MLPEMKLPLVAHFVGECLEQFEIAGVGEKMPGVQADFILTGLPVAGHVAEVAVVSEVLPLVLEGENAPGKLPGKQPFVEVIVALGKSDVVPDMLMSFHALIVPYETILQTAKLRPLLKANGICVGRSGLVTTKLTTKRFTSNDKLTG